MLANSQTIGNALENHFCERKVIHQLDPKIPVYDNCAMNVPAYVKQDIMDELRLLNITLDTLFPGLDEAAQAVTRQHSNYLKFRFPDLI